MTTSEAFAGVTTSEAFAGVTEVLGPVDVLVVHHLGSRAQVVHPDDIPRFRGLDVAANAQPLWACHEGQMDNLTIPFLGDRWRWQYPFRSLRAAGAVLAMGSDWSVSSPDPMLEMELAVERLPGAHCYQMFAGNAEFDDLAAREPGTFYLTDFLVRHFDRLVYQGLGLDRFPELRPAYFGNYRKLTYLAQTHDEGLQRKAAESASFLGLEYEYRYTGLFSLQRHMAAALPS